MSQPLHPFSTLIVVLLNLATASCGGEAAGPVDGGDVDTTMVNQRYADGRWRNVSQLLRANMPDGTPAWTMLQRWEGDRWVSVARYSFSYDSSGQVVEEMEERSAGTKWMKSARHRYDVDTQGNRIFEVREVQTASEWLPEWRKQARFDDANRPASSSTELRLDGDWQSEGRVDYSYFDADSQWVRLEIRPLFDDEGKSQKIGPDTATAWVNVAMSTSRTDGEGRVVERLSERWMNERWTPVSRETYRYDGGKLAEYRQYSWAGDRWAETMKVDHRYNAEGEQVISLTYAWDEGEWVLASRTLYQ